MRPMMIPVEFVAAIWSDSEARWRVLFRGRSEADVAMRFGAWLDRRSRDERGYWLMCDCDGDESPEHLEARLQMVPCPERRQ